jgi:hypothetical protein
MATKIKDIQWSFDFAKIVPPKDQDMIYFEEFKQLFGEDGNIMAIGVDDSSLYQPDNFRKYKYLTEEITRLEGVNNVLSLANLQQLIKDSQAKRFNVQPLFENVPDDAKVLDSLLAIARNLKFYSGQIVNEANGATIMLVAINKEVLNSKKREVLVGDIIMAGDAFSRSTGIDLKYAGLPYVRSIMTGKVADELKMFLIFSVIITGLVMFLLFRSWDAVVFPLIIIGVLIVWSLGTLALFNYKITLLTGLLPPIIVVIGIPNCVYLLNKYHQEFYRHNNKIKALSRMIHKIGFVALITNSTTAVGFIVLAFTNIQFLKEFGIVAAVNVLATFLVSIILIPAVFSYLPEPNTRQLRHLRFRPLELILETFDFIVHHYANRIFIITGIIVAISLVGVWQLYSVSYIVDDLPEESEVRADLAFFEREFGGIMPLELVVDTKKRKGIMNMRNLRKVSQLEDTLYSHPDISKPVSIVSFVKASKQAFYNNNPDRYELPNNRERSFILRYLNNNNDSTGVLNAFADTLGQKMRVSLSIADIGSNRLDSLVNNFIRPQIDSIFSKSEIDVLITGTTLLFVKGNKFLIENLRQSMLLAFIVIAFIMGLLFRNGKMILISIIPNIIPMLITAGLMGYFNIPLKPSTALIFSIAFGISVDDSIHFLAKYRMELFAHKFNVSKAISKSIKETGASMIYTSVILFFGFIIFSLSEFLGTVSLGVLTSTTLLCAMFTNLIVLPTLLIKFDSGKRNINVHPLIEQVDDFYDETEDEAIDLSRLEIEESETQGNTSK